METDVEKTASEIAAALGETGERPRAQIGRIVGLMGAEWTRGVLRAMGDGAPDEALTRKDGQLRTIGGVFFAWARACARSEMARGHHDIPRRQFYRCFFDYPPKPRAPKPPPPKKKRTPRPNPGAAAKRVHDRRGREAVAPEVYLRRAVR